MAMRQELAVLFRAIARRRPPGAGRGAGRWPGRSKVAAAASPRWQTVETALAALHLVGEGAHDGAVKPGVEESPLGELVEMLLGAWDVLGSKSPAVAAHRLVAPALLEICVRYHLAVERRPALLRPALAAFLDGRGVMHPAREVSRRACYLFCRFVKPTRGLILCHGALPGVMAALEPALMDASVPEFATSSAASSVGSSCTGGGTGGAMARAGNDDRLYVFEAFGLLLGIDDVPDDLRIRCLEAVFARLRGAVEAASNSHSPANQNPAAAQHAIVAMGNVAKGFTLRVATQTSPRVGEILASGLDPALRCVQLWPRDPLTRQRVVAYFQRLVTVVGPAVFPYASPLLEHMRSGSPSASELRECLVLINQLMASFKESLAPFLATQLPPLVTQISDALAPFAAPGGGVNGVCGLFLDGARRVNPRLVPNDDGGSGGANAAGGAVVGAAGNTEEAREARDLEKIFVAHAHGVAANNLAGVLVADPRLRECFLETLAAAASAHPSAMSRKSALQALIRVAQCWLPTAEVVARGGCPRGPGAGIRGVRGAEGGEGGVRRRGDARGSGPEGRGMRRRRRGDCELYAGDARAVGGRVCESPEGELARRCVGAGSGEPRPGVRQAGDEHDAEQREGGEGVRGGVRQDCAGEEPGGGEQQVHARDVKAVFWHLTVEFDTSHARPRLSPPTTPRRLRVPAVSPRRCRSSPPVTRSPPRSRAASAPAAAA